MILLHNSSSDNKYVVPNLLSVYSEQNSLIQQAVYSCIVSVLMSPPLLTLMYGRYYILQQVVVTHTRQHSFLIRLLFVLHTRLRCQGDWPDRWLNRTSTIKFSSWHPETGKVSGKKRRIQGEASLGEIWTFSQHDRSNYIIRCFVFGLACVPQTIEPRFKGGSLYHLFVYFVFFSFFL